jgi:GT2 family glycosyltransferase
MHHIGVVIIGRNEGNRLRFCLAGMRGLSGRVVYVDSGSTDGSPAAAREMGVDVVQLDADVAFTAARARNAGARRLAEIAPSAELVQFLDGDCEVEPGWLSAGAAALDARPDVAVVFGRRRERFPDASIYNRLCDLEWNTPIGEATECGGDAMMRLSAFQQAGGYDPNLIAGEEPELCVRLRNNGWKLFRIDAPMTRHDAAMLHFSQWWRRNLRAGHAYAEGSALHGNEPTRHWVKQARSNWAWGLVLPAAALILAYPTRGISVAAALALYGVLGLKVYWARRKSAQGNEFAALYAAACVVAKIPLAWGQLGFWVGKFRGRRAGLIEYKLPPESTGTMAVDPTLSS